VSCASACGSLWALHLIQRIDPALKRPRKPRPSPGVPDRSTLLAFLKEARTELAPRDIAKAFAIKGDERRALNQLLRELKAEGVVASTGRKSIASGETPPDGGVFEVVELSLDGEPLARASGRDGLYGPAILVVPERRGRAPDGPPPGIGDRFVGKTRPSRGEPGEGPAFEVAVVKRLGHSAHRVYGVYRTGGVGTLGGGRIIPSDRKSRHELVVAGGDAGEAKDGDLVAVRLLPHRGFGPKRAEVLDVFGHADDPRAASILAVAAHAIPIGFTDAEEEQAQAARPATLDGRTDLRHLPLVTIDPEDARDHDDAVFAEALPGGGHRVVVAIADVAHYVPPGSALDLGALKRGNSVYFPDRVVPMLPERLSADLCSLREAQERPCLAVEMTFDAAGQKTGHVFARAIMKSAAKLSYQQAQAAIDGAPDEATGPLLEGVLKPLWAAYRTMGLGRAARKPLEIASSERKIVLSPEGKVVSIAPRQQLEAHRLIEEMMIQANVCAAETLEKHRTPLVYRIHDQPTDAKIAALGDFLATLQIKWTKGETVSPSRFNRILALTRETEHAETVNEMVLRTQAQAVYDTANIGHFGLNLLRYAHFTSPIRRYADLIVHRALIRALGLGDDGLADHEIAGLKRVAEAITTAERRAMAAEREATDRYVAAFLAERTGAVFAGRITGITRFGLFVRLAETGGDGLVPVSSLGGEYWHHDEAAHALIGTESGDRWTLGMLVEVRLIEAAPVTGGLIFDILSDPRTGPRPGRQGFRTGPFPRPSARPGTRPKGGGVKRRRK
jgi:ribonuclease R